jgi:hypothetical protein
MPASYPKHDARGHGFDAEKSRLLSAARSRIAARSFLTLHWGYGLVLRSPGGVETALG